MRLRPQSRGWGPAGSARQRRARFRLCSMKQVQSDCKTIFLYEVTSY